MDDPQPLAAVLAGGAGKRIGGAKPLQELAGRPLIAYPVAAAQSAGLETVVVAKDDSPLPDLPCAVIGEPELPRHPLCGLIAALEYADGRPVLALACDMPFLTPSLLAYLAREPGNALTLLDERPQPLLARYMPQALTALRGALVAERPLTAAALALEPRLIGERELAAFGDTKLLCMSVNNRAQLARAEELIGRMTTERPEDALALMR